MCHENGLNACLFFYRMVTCMTRSYLLCFPARSVPSGTVRQGLQASVTPDFVCGLQCKVIVYGTGRCCCRYDFYCRRVCCRKGFRLLFYKPVRKRYGFQPCVIWFLFGQSWSLCGFILVKIGFVLVSYWSYVVKFEPRMGKIVSLYISSVFILVRFGSLCGFISVII